ncbi:hypothetical protein ACSSS7_003077 [Eimeria intestinalis]
MWQFGSCPQSLAPPTEGVAPKEGLGAPVDVDKQGTLPMQEQELQLPQCLHPAVSRQLGAGASDALSSIHVGRREGISHEQAG